jgi:hypothetical protein
VPGVPVELLLFALTLIGVAVFHRYTLRIALTGLGVIVLYKLAFTGFKTGTGLEGFLGHMRHEWVILTNLLCLLVGFALLSNHFEKSRVPDAPAALSARRLEGLLRPAGDRSSCCRAFLDKHRRGAHRRGDSGGGLPAQSAHRIPRGHRGRFQCRARAASSGTTTTTMMWLDGVSPLAVLDAYVPPVGGAGDLRHPPPRSSSSATRPS